jgi:hypothetical protein
MDIERFRKLLPFAFGHFVVQALGAAVEFKIAELLEGGPRTARDLAKASKTNEAFLNRLMHVLVAFDFFKYDPATDTFGHNDNSPYLMKKSPLTLAPQLEMLCSDWMWSAFGNLQAALKKGKSAFGLTHGKEIFPYLQKNKAASAIFDFRMNGRPEWRVKSLLENYDFGSYRRIVDVGGGRGGILMGILDKYSGVEGVLFDLKASIDVAKKVGKERGLEHRCDFVVGDFFKKIPAGDLMILAIVLHDWTDKNCIKILKNCRKALAGATSPHPKVVILERILKPGERQIDARLIDLEMMVATDGGRERTEAEFRALLEASGFTLSRVIPAYPMNILEAVPV